MNKLLMLLISFAFIFTVRATDISDLIIEGLPVKVLPSGKSYKVFEQYPWEGHSSNYGPLSITLDRAVSHKMAVMTASSFAIATRSKRPRKEAT